MPISAFLTDARAACRRGLRIRPDRADSARSRVPGGFTLIEILVSIGLMALIMGVFVPSFVSAFRASPESEGRKLSGLFSNARDRALLTGKLVRLKIDLDKQTLNFEEAPGEYLVPKEPERPPSEREREELDKKEASTFTQSTELLSKTMEMPRGLKLIQVRSPRYKKPMTEGIAFVFFFPNGNTDGATVFLETDEKVHSAITVHPITGLSKIEPLGPEDKK